MNEEFIEEEVMGASSLPPARTYTTDTLLRWLCLAVTGNNSPFYILLI